MLKQKMLDEGGKKVGAVIPAAGSSQRMGADKLFFPILKHPLLYWTLLPFQSCPYINSIVLVLNRDNWQEGKRLIEECGFTKANQLCLGGAHRQDSVREGLKGLGDCSWVVIHDGARPCVTVELIERGLKEAQRYKAAIAAVPVKDTIKIEGEDNIVESTPERKRLWIAQTPQIFHLDLIKRAYERDEEVSDDASLIEKMGYPVRLYFGSYENIKVTTADDMALAEIILKRRGYAGGVGV